MPSMPPNRRLHPVDWNEEKIASYWSVLSEVDKQQFFSKRAGAAFLAVAKQHLGHTVLDVGCGDGTLVREMRTQGYDAVGVDPSAPDERHLFRMKGSELANLGLARFDSAVSLETFEHVLPHQLPVTLSATAQVLKPGGKLVFTVPFEENLERETCVCPDCHATFHRWQHQQSFSAPALDMLLSSAGLEMLSFRKFEVPPVLRVAPRLLRPLYCFAWGWLKRRFHRNVSMLVVARRRS